MKKIICLLMAFILVFSLAACGSTEDSSDNAEAEVETPDVSEKEEVEEEDDHNGYSYNRLTGEYDLDPELEGNRPIAVSVNNNSAGLPQKGISEADIIYEIETEGGITRLMAVYSDVSGINYIGSVRSLRNQFLEAVLPLDAMIVHIGGSNPALSALSTYGYATLNGYYAPDVEQDSSRTAYYASEHTWMTNEELIQKGIDYFDMRTTTDDTDSAFNFSDSASLDGGTCTKLNFSFSSSYDGEFTYDETTGLYTASQHGKERYDANTGDTLTFKNVFILSAAKTGFYSGTVSPIFDYSQGGTGWYISGGKYETFTWTKPTYSDNFTFYGADGKELEVNPGNSYVGIINNGQEATVTIS